MVTIFGLLWTLIQAIPLINQHVEDARGREDAYVLQAAPAAYGAVLVTLKAIDEISAQASLDGAEPLSEKQLKGALIFAKLRLGRDLAAFFCGKYAPASVPARFADVDVQVRSGCTAMSLAYSGMIESAEELDEDRIQESMSGLKAATGQLLAPASTLAPIIKERNLDTKNVFDQWMAEAAKKADSK